MSDKSLKEVKLAPADYGVVFPFLRIYEENGPFLKSFKITSRLVVIGRDKGADLRIQDKYISRKHFQIEFLGEGKLFLQDLGSANGTFLNGKKAERVKLEDGDEIVVGEKRVVVSYKLPKPKAEELKPKVKPESATIPEISKKAFSLQKTEIASEEEVLEREAKKIAEVIKKSPAGKKLKLVSRPKAKPEITMAEEEADAEAESIEKIMKIASAKERREAVRFEEYEGEERKIKLSKILFILIAGLIVILLLVEVFRYTKNYLTRENNLARVENVSEENQKTGTTDKVVEEKLVIPRPDVRVSEVKPAESSKESILKPDLTRELPKIPRTSTREDIKKTAAAAPGYVEPSKPKGGQLAKEVKASQSSAGRKNREDVVVEEDQPEPKRTVVAERPVRELKPRPAVEKPTVVAEAVKSLRQKEAFGVDLNKASKTLVASREVTDGKGTSPSPRDIDIKEIQKMLDIDVNLSIMSEEVMLSEKRDVNQFRSNLKERISNVSYCYQEALKRDTSLHGNIKVNFTVGRGGKVNRASIDNSTLRDKGLDSCIIRRVKDTRFDEPPHDNFTITYTFKFRKNVMDFTK